MLSRIKGWWNRASLRRQLMYDVKQFNRVWDERAARAQVQES
jgi:hypothetical protein